MEDRLIEVEKKLAFQENTIEDLNQMILDQNKRIDALKAQIKVLEYRMSTEEFVKPIEDEEPPPHY